MSSVSSQSPSSSSSPSPFADVKSCDEIHWPDWKATDLATLTFVFRATEQGDEILLIRKKRGLGAGKVNGPGGRLEGDESPAQCAVREVQEELGVTPIRPEHVGKLYFQFVDGYGLEVFVFKTWTFEGEAYETDEAVPLWTRADAVPFDEMWADDHLWFPHMLAGRPFSGRFIFDGDAMLDVDLQEVASAAEA